MTIPDSSYKQIANDVYNVDPNKVERTDDKLVIEGRSVYDDRTDKEYKVLKIQDNNNDVDTSNNNGLQAMAVAPIVDGKVDTSQIVIAYAGTDFGDEHDRDTDAQMVIGGNTKTLSTDTKAVSLDSSIIQTSPAVVLIDTTITESQLVSAQKFYAQIKEEYPHSVLTTTGHSLGAYLALIVAAEHQIPASTFNGPDPVRGMSSEAKKWVKANRNMYNNYRINYDLIGNFGAYFGTDDLGISRNVAANKSTMNLLYNHDLRSYRFNRDGQIVDKAGNTIGTQYLLSQNYLSFITSQKQMVKFDRLKQKWMASGSGLSSGEELFLDAAQGYILGQAMAQSSRLGVTEASSYRDAANADIEALWSSIDYHSYTELQPYEVKSLFASHGITYEEFVGEFKSYTDNAVATMSHLATDFETLQSEFQSVIDSKLALDNQLAGEFKSWYAEL